MMKRTHEAGGSPPGPAGTEPRRLGPRPVSSERATIPERDEPTLADLAWTLVERRWTVVVVTAIALLAAAAYLFVAPPVYESSVLVQVEGRARPAGSEDLVRLFDTTPRTEGEMRILRSRALLEGVVEELGLDIEARPRMVPLVGPALTRRYEGTAPAPAPLGLARFGWGGERIAVKQLVVPESLLDRELALVAREGGRYELTVRDGDAPASGAVGETVTAGEADGRVTLVVSELEARPGTEFVLRRLRRDEVIRELQKRLTVAEQGRDGGLVEVTLRGPDPGLVARFLDLLATTYVRQSLERTSAEAASALRVLEDQLPALKAKVDEADDALNRFHRRNRGINLSVDAERLLVRMGELDRAIADAEIAEMELTRRHTARYPEPLDPAQRLPRLRSERTALEARLHALPALELEYTRLVRNVSLATERYMRVLDRAEALRTVKSGWTGNARVMEHAVAQHRPVSPKKGLAAVLAGLVGLLGGVVAAFLRSAFDEGLRDPDEIEARTGVPVFATIPRSTAQRRIAQRGGRRGRLEALSVVAPGDAAVEDLRALRTGVEFALRRAKNNIVVVGSPAPRAGKSFVSVNLAHLLSAFDGRVLLVDGDLRRGILHRYFGLELQPGVSDVLLGEAKLEAAVHRTDNPNLDLLPTGRRVTNPAELLAAAPLLQLLDEVRSRYKVVIVDTPPILSVTDSALFARHAGVNLLVLRAREQNAHEVSLAVRRLVQDGASVRGAVLNDVRPTLGRYGRSGGYRRYDPRDA